MSFTPDYQGIGEMLRADWMVAEMERRAKAVLEVAEASAPYDETAPDPHYKDMFRIETSAHGGVHKDRAEAKVINDHPLAFQIEYGTGRDGDRPQGGSSPRFRVLGRAIDAAKE